MADLNPNMSVFTLNVETHQLNRDYQDGLKNDLIRCFP